MPNENYRFVAFKGSDEYKLSIINDFERWTFAKNLPKSAEERAAEIVSTHRVIKPSKSVFENYDLYPEKLGLPLWIAYLNETIERCYVETFNQEVYSYLKAFFSS